MVQARDFVPCPQVALEVEALDNADARGNAGASGEKEGGQHDADFECLHCVSLHPEDLHSGGGLSVRPGPARAGASAVAGA